MSKGYSVGYLEQEPPLDETKTVGENIDIITDEYEAMRVEQSAAYEVLVQELTSQ